MIKPFLPRKRHDQPMNYLEEACQVPIADPLFYIAMANSVAQGATI